MKRLLVERLGHDSAPDLLAALVTPTNAEPVESSRGATEALDVSVVIPAYNRPSMLRRALQSVASQRPGPAEVIVVDDGSSEDLERVVAEFDAELIRHAENRGLAAARNTGVSAARHPWIALLDSDDEWLPHHLGTLWQLRDDHLMVTSSAVRCAKDPGEDRVQGPLRPSPVVLTSPASLLYPDNFICPSAAMVRRDAVLAAGGFAARNGVEDLHLWCRLLDRGTGVASPVVSLRYHIHEEQMSHDFERIHAAHLMVIEEFAGSSWWSRALVERREGTAAWSRFREHRARGDSVAALRAAGGIFARPQRAFGVVGILVYRLLRRRRSGRVQRDGKPSIVVLPRGSEPKTLAIEALGPAAISDWRHLSPGAAAVRLVRRPSAIAIVDSVAQALVARLAGVRPVSAEAVGKLGGRGLVGTGAQSWLPLRDHSA